MLVQPTAAPQYFSHSDGTTQATSSGVKRKVRSVSLDQATSAISIRNHRARTRIENPADHSGENHEEHGQQLEVATQDTACLNMGQVFG